MACSAQAASPRPKGSGSDFLCELLLSGLPVPGEEFVKAALRYVGDPGEDVGEPGERIDIVETRGAKEAEHHRGALATTVRADEQL